MQQTQVRTVNEEMRCGGRRKVKVKTREMVKTTYVGH